MGGWVRSQEGPVRLALPSRFTALSAQATTLGLQPHPPAPLLVLHAG